MTTDRALRVLTYVMDDVADKERNEQNPSWVYDDFFALKKYIERNGLC